MWRTWVPTVFSDMLRRSAIQGCVRPYASSRPISRSRAVRPMLSNQASMRSSWVARSSPERLGCWRPVSIHMSSLLSSSTVAMTTR